MDDGDAVDADDDLLGFFGGGGDHVVIAAQGGGEGRVDLDGIAYIFPRYSDDPAQDGLLFIRFQVGLFADVCAFQYVPVLADVIVGSGFGEGRGRQK